ncbi:centriolar coiled-coil protein of 110 kDa-like isoform X2 [Antennarius striatus]|uniref:centriolar coiled-coil protein of 110 kDa-like isoform X2 n=1 Tax=Antennarius striatus TaxID=241820 RepID=UPI0035ADC9F0
MTRLHGVCSPLRVWMCGCSEMESYEEFCLRTLATLKEKGGFQKMTCDPLWSLKAGSVISFNGRAVLSPLLSAEQRSEMCEHRRRAVQLEMNKQNTQRNKVLVQVQDTLAQPQIQKAPRQEVNKLPVSRSATVTGYALVTDSPGHPRDPGLGLHTKVLPPSPSVMVPLFRGCKAVEEVKVESEEKSEEEEEDDMSLDSLLKRSKDFVKEEHSQQSKAVHMVAKTPSEITADQERRTVPPRMDTGVEFGFSLHHSPVGTPQTHIQHQTLYETNPQQSCYLSPSLPDRYACLPSPESSVSPSPQRRKPRPVSTGNIHITFPIGPADLIPRDSVRSGDGVCVAQRRDDLPGGAKSPDHWNTAGSEFSSSRGGTSPMQDTHSPVSASGCCPMGHRDHLAAGFRRRCYTLDSQPHSYRSGIENIDRSQERVPRFMAGVTWAAPSRRSPAAATNQLYDRDNPSPSLLRPRMTSDMAQVSLRIESDDAQRTNNGRIPSAIFRTATETQAEESKRRAHGVEDMQRLLKEDPAFQMSLFLAEQEKEQQHLHLECETGRRLKEQGCVQPLGGDAYGWTGRSVADRCPIVSPSCPGLKLVYTPSEPLPGHGFPSPVKSCVSSPSIQPPVYLWEPAWAISKPQARLSLVLTAEQQRAFCKIGAIIRGFLTRSLLKTEKVKHLRKTVVDTREFIRSFQTEGTQRRSASSEQDRSLEERVRAQLRAALYDIHNIFFEKPLGDRFVLLQQERELQAERKLRDMEKAKCPKERFVLSAATQRSLDRKKKVNESPAQARKMQQKPKSPTTNRSQAHQGPKPNQGQNSPQLNRQGSWYRRTPEERMRRSDSLKKQHSLG